MKVCILGASNAMLKKSWTDILSESFEITKHAAGGCNSSFGIYKICEKEDVLKNDFIIYNFGVTENIEIKEGHVEKEHLYYLINSMYSIKDKSAKNYLSLYLPTLNENDDEFSYKAHKELSNKNNVFFIDGKKFIKNILKKIDYINEKPLFLDAYHVDPIVASFIGYAIKDVLHYISSEKCFFFKDENLKNNFSCIKPVNCELSSDFKIERIENSYFNEIISIMNHGDTIKIRGTGFLHTLYIDCSRSNSKIKITGNDQTVVKHLYCRDPAIAKGDSQFKIIPLRKPLFFDGLLEIENIGIKEKTTETTRGERDFEPGNNSIYLCGFLTSSNIAPSKTIRNETLSIHQSHIDGIIDKHSERCAATLSHLTNIAGKDYSDWKNSNAPLDYYIRFAEKIFQNLGHDETSKSIRRMSKLKGLKKVHLNDYFLIKKSHIFDEKYYLSEYKDVKAAGIDPLSHYCNHGHREGRNPSASFITNSYRAEKGLSINTNPLSHYIINYLGYSQFDEV